MSFSIFIIPLSILFLYFSLTGLGSIFFKICSFDKKYSNLIFPIVSFPIIFFIVTILHLFTKLNPIYNFSIIFISLLLFIFNFKKLFIFNFNKKVNLIIFFLTLALVSIQFIGHKVNEDYGYYHLPYIVNFISDKLIFGLSHLSMVQGYNSAWLNVSAFFYFPFLTDKFIHFANSVLFFSVLIYFFNFLFNKKNIYNFPLSSLYSLLAISFFLIKNSRLNSFGVDVPGHIYASIIFFLFLNFCENKDFVFRKITFYIISFFSIFVILIKLSYIPLILIPFICLFFEKKILNIKLFIFLFSFGISWVIQQVAYTSCVIFPLDFTCFNFLSWYSESFINGAAFSLEYINKSYWVYEGSLTESEYVKNFNWVGTWFSRNLIELIENIIIFIIILFSLLIVNFFSKKNFKAPIKSYLLVAMIPIFFGFLLWFLKAPVTRYGIFYLNSFILLIFLFLFEGRLISNLNYKFIIIVLSISLTFNITKNINRISKLDPYENFPFPKKIKIVYDSVKNNNLTFNSPISQGDVQSSVCWDTPVYCRAGKFDNINIIKKNSYTFITPKKF